MRKRLYVAYGSNLNIRQMKYRCPFAKLYGTGVIEDYELQFKGRPTGAYATIAPKEGSVVPVAVWELKATDEKSLDYYEGYPSHYFKKDVPVKMDGKDITAMVYIMDLKMDFGLPSSYYYHVVYEGYLDCGLDTDFLENALIDSAKNYYDYEMTQNLQETIGAEPDEEVKPSEEEKPDEIDFACGNMTMW